MKIIFSAKVKENNIILKLCPNAFMDGEIRVNFMLEKWFQAEINKVFAAIDLRDYC